MQPTTLLVLTLSAVVSAIPTTDMTTLAVEVPAISAASLPAGNLTARALYENVWRDVKMCPETMLRGRCLKQRIKANGSCYNLPANLNDKLSSMWTSRAVCYLFRNAYCDMKREEPKRVEAPGLNTFQAIQFDNVASSFRCFHYDWT